MTKLVLTLACAVALLFACAEAPAAAQGGAAPSAPDAKPAPPASPKPAEGEGTKADEGEAAKPEDGAPSAGAESAAAPPEGESGPLTLAELTRDGFEIRTTNFIPAEADAPIGQSLLRRLRRHLAEGDLDRNLLLHAESLCG
jgi:hypothetical protein